VRRRLSPSTGIVLDEIGTDTNLRGGKPTDVPLYWVASGAYFAYLFARAAVLGVKVVGESQLMDDTAQESGVTMLDWVTGKPTARYWVVKLLVDEFDMGDRMQVTEVPGEFEGVVFAQAFVRKRGDRAVLVINKTGRHVAVSLQAAGVSMEKDTYAVVVDEVSGFGPPRYVLVSKATITLFPYATAVVIIP